MRALGLVFSLMVALGLGGVGCSGEGGTGKSLGDKEEPTQEGASSAGSCEREFELVEQTATQNTEQSVMYFVAKDSTTGTFNKIVLTSYQGGRNNGPTEPVTIDLAGSDYSTCSFCVMAYLNCTSDSSCETTLFADEGVVAVTELSGMSLPFKAELKDVVFKEITLDPFTQLASFVPEGERWCATDYQLEARLNRYDPSASVEDEGAIVPGEAYEACVAQGSGKGIGHNIADFSLQNCHGESVALHSRCATTKAVWLIAAAGW